MRELEYRRIIEEMQDEIKSKALLDVNDSKHMEDATITHKRILESIS